MTKASDNAFPSILITEGTEPAAPAAGKQRLYIDSTTHRLMRTNSSGVQVTADGPVAGSAFPASPATNDQFFRSDLGLHFYYDGTRWLTVNLYQRGIAADTDASARVISATVNAYCRDTSPTLGGCSDVWIVSYTTSFYVAAGGTALGASHKWAAALKSAQDGTNAVLDTIATNTVDSGSSAVTRRLTATVNALLNNGTVHDWFQIDVTKTGTPGTFQGFSEVTYRMVAV